MNVPKLSPEHLRNPQKALKFEPTEFKFTVAYAMEIAQDPGLFCDPQKAPFLADVPLNRFGLAIWHRFRRNTPKYSSFMWRWFALDDLLDWKEVDGRLSKHVDANDIAYPVEALYDLAATMPLTRTGTFNKSVMLPALRKLSRNI